MLVSHLQQCQIWRNIIIKNLLFHYVTPTCVCRTPALPVFLLFFPPSSTEGRVVTSGNLAWLGLHAIMAQIQRELNTGTKDSKTNPLTPHIGPTPITAKGTKARKNPLLRFLTLEHSSPWKMMFYVNRGYLVKILACLILKSILSPRKGHQYLVNITATWHSTDHQDKNRLQW